MNSARNYIFGRKSSSTLSTNLIASWNFNSNSNDSTVYAHNGTDTNMNYANTGKDGNCATFNGSSSFISVPQSTDFDFSTVSADVPFTISGWFNFSATGAGFEEIVNKQNGTNYQWLLRRVSNYFAFAIFTNVSNYKYWQFNAGTLTNGTWYHVVFIYDGLATNSSLKLYLNNSLVTSSITNVGTYTKMPITSQPLVIGKSGGSSVYYTGKIDALEIRKGTELNTTEIAELYNSGTGKFYPY